jgi:GTP cyclohydrolase I
METAVSSSEKVMPDVQAMADERGVALDRVGVRDVRWPVRVRVGGQAQTVPAKVNLYVDLPAHVRGTHMSRFLEVLVRHCELTPASVGDLLEAMRKRLGAEAAHIEAEHPLYLVREAPLSGAAGWMEYGCGVRATLNGRLDVEQRVRVPIATLCPCSREISERGAHNQRGWVDFAVRAGGAVGFEEQIRMVERAGSCALYPVLKRIDEKWVTERAYDNPRFVEDVVREVALQARADERVAWYRVEVENLESIHAHNAYASVEAWNVRPPGRSE